MKEHVVEEGECLLSIADHHGFFWKALWEHSANSELKEKRKNPNVLLKGDVVRIPDKEERVEVIASKQRHRFQLLGVPTKVRIELRRGGQAHECVRYKAEIDGVVTEGVTNSQGFVELSVPTGARKGTLVVGEGAERIEYRLNVGGLDPIDSPSGIQGRLNNLGFHCGDIDGQIGPVTETALKLFQASVGLPATGRLDEATRSKLDELTPLK